MRHLRFFWSTRERYKWHMRIVNKKILEGNHTWQCLKDNRLIKDTEYFKVTLHIDTALYYRNRKHLWRFLLYPLEINESTNSYKPGIIAWTFNFLIMSILLNILAHSPIDKTTLQYWLKTINIVLFDENPIHSERVTI